MDQNSLLGTAFLLGIIFVVGLVLTVLRGIIFRTPSYAEKKEAEHRQKMKTFEEIMPKFDFILESDHLDMISYRGAIPTTQASQVLPVNAKLLCVATIPEGTGIRATFEPEKTISVAGTTATLQSKNTVEGLLLKGRINVGEKCSIQLTPQLDLGERLIDGQAQHTFSLTAEPMELSMPPYGKVRTERESHTSIDTVDYYDAHYDELNRNMSKFSKGKDYFYSSRVYFLNK
jgi:hypothetical protein